MFCLTVVYFSGEWVATGKNSANRAGRQGQTRRGALPTRRSPLRSAEVPLPPWAEASRTGRGAEPNGGRRHQGVNGVRGGRAERQRNCRRPVCDISRRRKRDFRAPKASAPEPPAPPFPRAQAHAWGRAGLGEAQASGLGGTAAGVSGTTASQSGTLMTRKNRTRAPVEFNS